MNKPFPTRIVRHDTLQPGELAGLFCIDPEELSRSSYMGLLALIQGIIGQRAPGYHADFIPIRSSAGAEGYALCAHLLHEDSGFTATEITKGRAWLAATSQPLEKLLAFFFRMRTLSRERSLATATSKHLNSQV